jgi:hypothetical protein
MFHGDQYVRSETQGKGNLPVNLDVVDRHEYGDGQHDKGKVR